MRRTPTLQDDGHTPDPGVGRPRSGNLIALRSQACFLGVVAAVGCADPDEHTPEPDAPAPAPEVLQLSLRGPCSDPPTPDGSIVFPETAAGTQTTLRVLTATNDGPVNVQGRERIEWTFEGPDAAEFSLRPASSFDPQGCKFHYSSAGSPLGVGQECRLEVVFSPLTTGPKQATLRARATGLAVGVGGVVSGRAVVDQTFPLVAAAVATPARLYASAPEFYVDPGTRISPEAFQIVNGGTTSIDLGAPVVTAPFTFTSWNCPSPLPPGGACMVLLGITTTQPGCPTGQFTTTTSALTLPLVGRKVPFSLAVRAYGGTVRIDPPGVTCTNGTCPVTLPSPTQVTLTAEPEPGGHFLGWFQSLTGTPPHPCGSSPTCVLPASSPNSHLIAEFASATAKALSITISGTGEVSAGSMRCTASCTLYTEPGIPVTLSANTSGTFVGWSGDCTGASPTCNLGTVINDRAVTATFTP